MRRIDRDIEFLNSIDLSTISILDPKSKRILELRCGLADGKKRSLKEVANIVGEYIEKVRIIMDDSILKLDAANTKKNVTIIIDENIIDHHKGYHTHVDEEKSKQRLMDKIQQLISELYLKTNVDLKFDTVPDDTSMELYDYTMKPYNPFVSHKIRSFIRSNDWIVKEE